MKCQRCSAESVLKVSAKCSDLFWMCWPKGKEQNGYVPRFLNIGGGDYVEFSYCAECGQIQGRWPIKGFDQEDGE
jgi:hypothetical protein